MDDAVIPEEAMAQVTCSQSPLRRALLTLQHYTNAHENEMRRTGDEQIDPDDRGDGGAVDRHSQRDRPRRPRRVGLSERGREMNHVTADYKMGTGYTIIKHGPAEYSFICQLCALRRVVHGSLTDAKGIASDHGAAHLEEE